MDKKSRQKAIRTRLIWIAIIIAGFACLLAGPIFINYMFIAETTDWDVALAFSAGEMLQYYGAILGGLVMGLAIIVSLRINNTNRKKDWQKEQFERTYALYHKLPEILTRLEVAAIHVQYAARLKDEKLIELLDLMKESESVLREHHYRNDIYYSREIETSLKMILAASGNCQEKVELYLQEKKDSDTGADSVREAMEEAFSEFREAITKVKSEIMSEINKFVSVYDSQE